MACPCSTLGDQKWASDPAGQELSGVVCCPPCGCWERSWDPTGRTTCLLTAQTSLQPVVYPDYLKRAETGRAPPFSDARVKAQMK